MDEELNKYSLEDAPLLTVIRRKFSEAVDARKDILADQKLWLAYYLGNQWAYINRGTKMFVSPRAEDLREFEEKSRIKLLPINESKPAIDTVVAYMCKKSPKGYVRPGQGQSETRKSTAKVGTAIMDYEFQKDSFNANNVKRAKWATIAGTAFLVTYPDFTKWGFRMEPVMETVQQYSPQPVTDETGNPVTLEGGEPMLEQVPQLVQQQAMDENGMPRFVQVPVKTEIVGKCVAPNEIYPSSDGLEINDCSHIFWARMANLDDIKAEFKDLAKDLKEDDNMSATYQLDTQTFDFKAQDKKNLKLIIEYWEKPTSKLPRGRHCVIVDEKFFLNEEFPYWNTRKDGTEVWDGYRIVKFMFTDPLNSFWGRALHEPGIPISKAITALYSWMMSNVLPTASPKLFVQKGTMPGVKIIKNLPEIVEFEGTTPPTWGNPPMISPAIPNMIEKLEDKFKSVLGLHQVSMGEPPSQRTSGAAMSAMLEIDTDKFTAIFEANEESYRLYMYYILQNYKQFAPERLKEILPPEMENDIENFLKDDLDDTDVVIERDSSMPENRAGQLQLAQELVQYGFLNNLTPSQIKRFMSGMKQGWISDSIKDFTAAEQLAEYENGMILNGQTPVVGADQNHDVHIEILKAGLLDSTQWPQLQKPENQKVLQIALQHLSQHLQYMAQIQSAKVPPQQTTQSGQPAQPEQPQGGNYGG